MELKKNNSAKKITAYTAVFTVCFFALIAFSFFNSDKSNSPETIASRDIRLQFITYNGYGNNLYIDNTLTGKQPESDVLVNSITNIPYDTSYSVKTSGTDTISPVVSVSNIGKFAADSVYVHLKLNSGFSYEDSVLITPFFQGTTQTVMFDVMTYNIGSPLYLRAYTSYRLDSNRYNDTLDQYSEILPGFQRKVMYEEFTSNASPSCANNNPQIDLFLNNNIENVTMIKYHFPIGAPETDSFYVQNPEQNRQRAGFYFVQSYPTTIADGKFRVQIPYGDSSNLYTPYLSRLNTGTPLEINVNDERIEGDSIKSTITVNIVSAVLPGNYRLRVNAVERYVYSNSASNGETNFYDVFRRFYTDSAGVSVPVAKGTYQYVYTYYREPNWNDSMLYTAAFIQNYDTKEILNSGKGRNIVFNNMKQVSKVINGKPDVVLGQNIFYPKREVMNSSDSIQTSLNIELFEGVFPPPGWKVYNQDGYITFNKYTGANGPTFGGTNSVIMDFFDYNLIGQRDSMYSKNYYGLLATDTLRFDYAYAQFNSVNIDSLTVKISNDGGLTFPVEVFRKGGLNLATAPQTTSFFIPSNNTQWKSFKISLSNVVGINNYSQNTPIKFRLNQNYPNPFNPVTKINYELPFPGFVTLKVYDMLGREVALLVNSAQNAGSYSVDFNAGRDLSSGIYFYILNTDGFSDTKRMALLK